MHSSNSKWIDTQVHCKQSWQMPRRFFLEVSKPLGCVPNSTQVTGRKYKLSKTTCCCSKGHVRLLGLIQNVLLKWPMRSMEPYSALYEHFSGFLLHKRSHATWQHGGNGGMYVCRRGLYKIWENHVIWLESLRNDLTPSTLNVYPWASVFMCWFFNIFVCWNLLHS